MEVWRDISLMWLIFLTFIAVLPFGVIFFFAIMGMRRLRQVVKRFFPQAQEQVRIVAEKTEEIRAYCGERGIDVAACIPFDTAVTEAMVQGKPITAYHDGDVSAEIRKLWRHVRSRLAEL